MGTGTSTDSFEREDPVCHGDQWADMSQTLGRHREEQFWSFCRASGNVLSFDILKELPGKI